MAYWQFYIAIHRFVSYNSIRKLSNGNRYSVDNKVGKFTCRLNCKQLPSIAFSFSIPYAYVDRIISANFCWSLAGKLTILILLTSLKKMQANGIDFGSDLENMTMLLSVSFLETSSPVKILYPCSCNAS